MTVYNAYQLIDGREWGPGGGTAVSLTFSFLTSVPSYYSASNPGYFFFQEFTAEQKDAARSALEQVSQFANVTFTEVTGSTIGDVTFGQASLYYQGSYPYALAYYPENPTSGLSGDVWFSTIRNWSGEMDEGDYGYFVMMHEIGHALGLVHSFDAGLVGVEDSEQYTVMAYDNDPWGSIDARSFMLYDIAALQSIYGANTSYNNGDTTYVLDPTSAYTIWDGGGIDTFDASAQTSSVILNLEEGAFSSVGLVDNIAIAYGTVIENAIGGQGDDVIYGNAADNIFYGSAGADEYFGGSGDDMISYRYSTLLWASVDLLHGRHGSAAYRDVYHSIENVEGTEFADSIWGDDNDNDLYGRDGDDSILGFDGDDYLDGGNGADNLQGHSGNDHISGGNDNDTLLGQEGDDIINGGSGSDKIRGGLGNDEIYGGDDNDTDVTGDEGDDKVDGGDGDDIIQGSAGNDTVLGGLGNDQVYGDDKAGLLSGNDILDGGEGDDKLRGGLGDDTYIFSSGADNIYDLGGNDTLHFEDYRLIDLNIQIDPSDNDSLLITSGLDSVKIINHFDLASTIENITFEDGSFANLGNWLNWFGSGPYADTVSGSEISDTIVAVASGNYGPLNGLEGDDQIFGSDFDDIFNGGEGDDLIVGYDGFDEAYYKGDFADYNISGGTIEDTVGDEGTDTLIGVERLRFYDGYYENGVFVPDVADDYFAGTQAVDVFFGGAGVDRADYGGLPLGGITIDLLNGTASGGLADGDRLYSIEFIEGTYDDDVFIGNYEDNYFWGYNGDDIYVHNGGVDQVYDYFGEYQDRLILANALPYDAVFSFDGDDLLITIDPGVDEVRVINANSTFPTIDTIEFADGFYIDVGQWKIDEGIFLDYLKHTSWLYSNDINVISGTNSYDVIILGDADNEAKGFGGADYIYGGAGNDILRGYDGNDVLFGGAGVDKIVGGAGNDVIGGGDGDDTDLRGEEGDDILYGDAGNDKLIGDDVAETVTGNDQLFGGLGNDELRGGLGNDLLDGGEGDDTLEGGAGDDIYIASSGHDTIKDVGGIDAIQFGEGVSIFDLSFVPEVGDLNDLVILWDGNSITVENQTESLDSLQIEALLFADSTYVNFENFENWFIATTSGGKIHGSTLLDDTMIGNIGDDLFYGKEGDDQLFGGAGNDSLKGNDGDDLLVAGAGADRLEGHAGADSFVLSGQEVIDGNLNRVVDFTASDGDVIRIENILEGYDPLTDDINDFIQMSTTSHTYLDIDIDGSGVHHGFVADVIRIEHTGGDWSSAQDMIDQGHLIIA